MHELGITQNIVSIVSEHAKGKRVKRVVLEVGSLAGVMTGAITFCFDVVTKGTVLEGASLEIRAIQARALCRFCEDEFVQDTLFSPCPCGARDVKRISGEELNIKEFELETVEESLKDAPTGIAENQV